MSGFEDTPATISEDAESAPNAEIDGELAHEARPSAAAPDPNAGAIPTLEPLGELCDPHEGPAINIVGDPEDVAHKNRLVSEARDRESVERSRRARRLGRRALTTLPSKY